MKKTLMFSLILLLTFSGCLHVSENATEESTETEKVMGKKIIKISDEAEEANEEVVFEKLDGAAVLIAMPNPNQTPPPNNNANLMREFEIIAFNPTTGEEKLLTIIDNNFFIEPYGFNNNQIFYVGITGEIYSYDIYSKETTLINIPGILPTDEYLGEDTIRDFIIEGVEIIYLKGHCSEGLACALGKFDVSSRDNKIVIENLEDTISSSLFNVFRLYSYDHDSGLLTFRNGGGDAGVADIAIYEVDMNMGDLRKVDSANYYHCDNEHFSEECEDEVLAENKHFDEIVTKLDFGVKECLGAEITKGDRTQDYAITITSDEYLASYEKGVYIGCIDETAPAETEAEAIIEEKQISDPLPNEVLLPKEEDEKDLTEEESITFRGTASSGITQVEIFRYADNCESKAIIAAEKTLKTEGGFQWEQKITNDLNERWGMLCEGRNEFVIRFANDDRKNSKYEVLEEKTINIESNVGYSDLGDYETVQVLKKFESNKGIEVEDDVSLITTIDMRERCEALNLNEYTEDQYDIENDLTSYIPVSNSDNIYVKIKTDPNSEWEGAHVLEFFMKEGEDYQLIENIPPIERGDCIFSTSFNIYFYSPSNIIINSAPVFESYPMNVYLENGEWKHFEDLIAENLGMESIYGANPYYIKADRDYISVNETSYCCDTMPGLHPAKAVDFIFDIDTKEIVDVNLNRQKGFW